MQEFFHGWRRKTGCVTLMLAVVLTTGWMRSRTDSDSINMTRLLIGSADSSLVIVSMDHQEFRFPVWDTNESQDLREEIEKIDNFIYVWRSNGGVWGYYDNRSGSVVEVWIVPYWLLVLPLTGLSAWILLSKPRKPAAVPSDEAT